MDTFSALLALCAGNSPVPGEFPAQRPATRSFDVFFDLRLNNNWVNNCEAGDLRCHCAHYDVIVMKAVSVINLTSVVSLGDGIKLLLSSGVPQHEADILTIHTETNRVQAIIIEFNLRCHEVIQDFGWRC